MKITLEPGRYVVAVSGGVDSVVLLKLLTELQAERPGEYSFIVAHFDHGIRPDSAEDQQFVRALARQHGLPYVYDRAELGAGASEAAARTARYGFLHAARRAAAAQAIVTAHHQDDALETAVLNIVRGTGRRGLTSLKSTDSIKRPLLHVPKKHIVQYAQDNQFLWREDSTNSSDAYKRNYVRHNVLPRFDALGRAKLHTIISDMHHTNAEIDGLLDEILAAYVNQAGNLNRTKFLQLPHAVAREVMAAWLRRQGVQDIDSKMLERLVHAAKTFAFGRQIHVNRNRVLMVKKTYLALQH